MPKDVSKMSEKEKRLRKQLNIPLGAELTLLELEPDIERLTEGWTDEQILNKTVDHFDKQIEAAELGIDSLEETIAQERKRIRSIRKVRARRLELGA